jgi:hypothetical protein
MVRLVSILFLHGLDRPTDAFTRPRKSQYSTRLFPFWLLVVVFFCTRTRLTTRAARAKKNLSIG